MEPNAKLCLHFDSALLWDKFQLIEKVFLPKHLAWFTHKNAHSCWICELYLVAYKLFEETNIYAKSPLDIMNDSDIVTEQETVLGSNNERSEGA